MRELLRVGYVTCNALHERLHPSDVVPGLVFCFHKHIGRLGDTRLAFNDTTMTWTVVTVRRLDGIDEKPFGQWQFLLLSDGPTLEWHRGELGWIEVVIDPQRERG